MMLRSSWETAASARKCKTARAGPSGPPNAAKALTPTPTSWPKLVPERLAPEAAESAARER
jgi:hypothetical protein